MENKKALVIIPPYSEPLKKLGEILSTPEEAESIDIYVLEDLKEAGQLIPTLGQCLIVIANAKKCALFLQENRWAISKNHSKVILMTPKEIPQKTLMKFLKIGLTEVILETLPPKSLLYKIKLLLRSVKGQESKKEENINVKSMLDMSQQKNDDEQQRVEKGIIADTEVSAPSEDKEKKMIIEEDTDSFDYLKAKKKNQQEDNVIDTHWKSKRNDTQISLEDGEEIEKKKSSAEEISTYYKNERKANLDLDFIADENMSGKASGTEDESTFSIEKLKQAMLTEIELEDSLKDKKKNNSLEEDDEDIYHREQKETEINLEKEDTKKSDTFEDESDNERKRKNEDVTELSLEKEEKAKSDENLNLIDNYLKGKINNDKSIMEVDEEEFVDKKINEINEDDKDDSTQNNLSLDENEESEMSHASNLKEEINNTDQENEKGFQREESAEDGFMRGKISKNTDLNLQEEKKDSKTQQEESNNKERENSHKNSLDDLDDSLNDINKKTKTNEADEEIDNSDKNAEVDLTDESDDLRKKLQNELDLELEMSSDDDTPENQDQNKKNGVNKLQRLTVDDENENNNKLEKLNEDDARSQNLKKLANTQLEFEKEHDLDSTNASVEHLDKYMRSRSLKSEDQDWNIGTKKKDTAIALQKGKKDDVNLNLLPDFKDAGEQTIDYRKLKEEFELLKDGANLPPDEIEKIRKMIRGESEDSEDLYQVFSPSPNGVDFLVEIAIDLYDTSIKPRDIFEKIAKKIHEQKGFATFLQYSKPTEIKEIYSVFQITENGFISDETRNAFSEIKKENDLFKTQATYSLANWKCTEILDKNNRPWEDTELPTWAQNELQNKKVEYIYPMFDGLDRMGHIYIWFPDGIVANEARNIDIIIEASRPLFLDQIIRSSKNTKINDADENEDNQNNQKTGIFSGITSLFGKKKVG